MKTTTRKAHSPFGDDYKQWCKYVRSGRIVVNPRLIAAIDRIKTRRNAEKRAELEVS